MRSHGAAMAIAKAPKVAAMPIAMPQTAPQCMPLPTLPTLGHCGAYLRACKVAPSPKVAAPIGHGYGLPCADRPCVGLRRRNGMPIPCRYLAPMAAPHDLQMREFA